MIQAYLKSSRLATFSVLVLGIAVLVGCGSASRDTPSPTVTASPTPLPAATPTPVPAVVLIAEAEVAWGPELRDWAESKGWLLVQPDLPGAAPYIRESRSDVKAVVSNQTTLGGEIQAVAERGIPVVVVEGTDVVPGPWLSTVGEPGARHDQAGFMAGMIAGLASRTGWVGEISGTGGEHEPQYEVGFAQGLKYGCPKCQLISFSAGEASLDGFRAKGVDVVFPYPGPQTAAATQALVDGGLPLVWIGEEGFPSEALAGRLIFNSDASILPALEALLETGQGMAWPHAIEHQTIHLVDINVSPGRFRLLEEAYEAISTGALDIGTEPEGGE